jgi:hypothetical protein
MGHISRSESMAVRLVAFLAASQDTAILCSYYELTLIQVSVKVRCRLDHKKTIER